MEIPNIDNTKKNVPKKNKFTHNTQVIFTRNIANKGKIQNVYRPVQVINATKEQSHKCLEILNISK